MAANTAQISALSADSQFRQRIRALVMQQAAVVYLESAGTANHAARSTYAIKLLQSPGLADQVADVIANRTNLVASTVTYDFDRRAVVTDATDAAIASQIATDWNMLAGV